MKRFADCILSILCLIIFSPLLLLCAIAIRMEDGLPVIYSQERIGLHGKPFMIYKFRSMRMNAEEDGAPLLLEKKDDNRLTHVGGFLRRHHLDELPQLWNVLKGDMAFIGPRPERKFYIDQIMEYDPRYRFLYQIRPGVTSYATLYNGYTDTMEKMLRRLRYDLFYLEHRSWFFDFKILVKTFLNIAFPATSALPVAEVAISALVAAARPLIGLSILTTMLLVFKPLITGMLRALKLAVFPNKTREEKSAMRNLRSMLAVRNIANELDSTSPNMAAELRALAARG